MHSIRTRNTDSVAALPSATVVVVREGEPDPEILMVRRRAGDVFGDSYTFPGGLVDDNEPAAHEYCKGITADEADKLLHVPNDGLNFYSAAIRELFEETGILLAQDAAGNWALDTPELQQVRVQVGKGILGWSDFLCDQELNAACDALLYFAHWETPLNKPKRWSARFFIAEAPSGQVASHDDGELTDLRWMTATEALSCGREGNMKLPFPTIRTLKTIAEFDSADALLDWARAKSLHGVDKTRPVQLLEDGIARFVISGDPDYPQGGDGEA
jgi:8-oxo-dGTP pyrophosphatase MutT (NUDIX family)